MTDPSEGRKPDTGRASDGGENPAEGPASEVKASARPARDFRGESFSLVLFHSKSSKRSWPVREPEHLFGNIAQGTHPDCRADGNPNDSIFEHGRGVIAHIAV
jgi:hypothetical protein